MSDEFKRELREIGSRLKIRREATLNAQQDQLSRVDAAIQLWEKGIASNIKQAVQEANTALAETGVSLACAEGTAGPVDSGGRVGPSILKTRPKMTITIIEDDGFERRRTTNKQLEISLTQGG
jgi:multidrug efflux pump subunit AcrA (membrane-fusion protein)